MMSSDESGHFPALDGLRALAILLVLPHNLNILSDPLPGAYYFWGKFVELGWIGVQLFFVLSGFLITRGLLETREAPNFYRAFFGRRVLRIFPLYFVTLIALFVIWPALSPQAPTAAEPASRQIWYWTFLANWSSPLGGDIKGVSHFWSLAVEEQFYLLWPFVIHRRTNESVLRICMALVVLAFCFRLLFVTGSADAQFPYMFTVCRMDALASGAMIAIVYSDPERRELLCRHQATLLLAAGVILLAAEVTTQGFFWENHAALTWGHLALDGAFACLVAAAVIGRSGSAPLFNQVFSNSSMRTIGRYSYGMYVIHYPINRYLARPWIESLHPSRATGIAYVLLMMLLTFLLAFLSYHLLERHFLRLKVYFQPVAIQNS